MKARLAKDRPKSYANFGEIGRSGLRQRNGTIDEEFLREWKGKDGRKVIREMMDNDSIVSSMLFAISMLIRQAKPRMKPAIEATSTPKPKGQSPSRGDAPVKKFRLVVRNGKTVLKAAPASQDTAESSASKDAAEFVQSCFDDMSETWADVVSEILTMLPYGWAWLETVYKKRNGTSRDASQNSRYTDGRIGWRKMALRGQDTLKKWVLDDQGGVRAMVQTTDVGKDVTIPIEKSLLFRTVHNKNNPEGRSVLRGMYRSWYFKKRIEEIEGIGIERDLAGLPVLTGPEDFDLWNENDPLAVTAKHEAEIIVKSIRRDEQEGVLLPYGWTLELLASAGKRNFDTTTVIGRYNNNMAMTMLADFIVLGHNNRYGSFALSSSKTHMFAVALGGWLDAIAAVFNRYAIPRLLEINGMPLDNPPIMEFEDIELPDLAELGTYMYRLNQAGFQMFPNIPLEKKLLAAASMPTEDMELGRDPIEHAKLLAEATAPAVQPGTLPNGKPSPTTSSSGKRPQAANGKNPRSSTSGTRVPAKQPRR